MTNKAEFNRNIAIFIEDTFQLEKNEAIMSIHIILNPTNRAKTISTYIFLTVNQKFYCVRVVWY